WAYARIIAYILIGITLITIAFAGIKHAMTVDPDIISWVEVVLVVARSVMTVLYGQAIHSLKTDEHMEQDRIAELEQVVSNLTVQLDTEQKAVSSLRVQLDREQRKVSSVQQQMDKEVSSVQLQVSSTMAEVDTLHVQLEAEQKKVKEVQQQSG